MTAHRRNRMAADLVRVMQPGTCLYQGEIVESLGNGVYESLAVWGWNPTLPPRDEDERRERWIYPGVGDLRLRDIVRTMAWHRNAPFEYDPAEEDRPGYRLYLELGESPEFLNCEDLKRKTICCPIPGAHDD